MHASTANCVAAAITTLRWDRLYITLHHPFAVRDKNPDHNPPKTVQRFEYRSFRNAQDCF